MRELLRSIARANMERSGLVHVNKRPGKLPGQKRGKSFFANNWRAYLRYVPQKNRHG